MDDKAMSGGYTDSRQASVLGSRSNDVGEIVERFRDKLRETKQRWDNRLVLEKTPLFEGYLDGRFEIALYGDWGAPLQESYWVCRVAPYGRVDQLEITHLDGDCVELDNGDGRQDEVVLVDIVDLRNREKATIPVKVRLYRVPNMRCGVGQGILYRDISGMGFKFFPFFREWERDVLRSNAPRQADGPVVQGRAKIVDRISDDEGEALWNWLFGPKGQIKTIGLGQYGLGSGWPILNLVQIFGKGGGKADERINVALCPFDL